MINTLTPGKMTFLNLYIVTARPGWGLWLIVQGEEIFFLFLIPKNNFLCLCRSALSNYSIPQRNITQTTTLIVLKGDAPFLRVLILATLRWGRRKALERGSPCSRRGSSYSRIPVIRIVNFVSTSWEKSKLPPWIYYEADVSSVN